MDNKRLKKDEFGLLPIDPNREINKRVYEAVSEAKLNHGRNNEFLDALISWKVSENKFYNDKAKCKLANLVLENIKNKYVVDALKKIYTNEYLSEVNMKYAKEKEIIIYEYLEVFYKNVLALIKRYKRYYQDFLGEKIKLDYKTCYSRLDKPEKDYTKMERRIESYDTILSTLYFFTKDPYFKKTGHRNIILDDFTDEVDDYISSKSNDYVDYSEIIGLLLSDIKGYSPLVTIEIQQEILQTIKSYLIQSEVESKSINKRRL